MTINFKIYEDNAGGLYLCIMSDTGHCDRIFENFEYGPPGTLANAIAQLTENTTAYEAWDGDLVARLMGDGQNVTAQTLYDGGLGDLIADSTGYRNQDMGFAGRKALNFDMEQTEAPEEGEELEP